MKENSKMTLKVFTETYTNILKQCSADELGAILTEMANKVSVTGRQAFIDQLLSAKPIKTESLSVKTDVLDEIEVIQSEILEQSKEEPDWETYDEEDSLSGYEYFVEPLSELFDKVEAIFDYGNPEVARKAYELLFLILEIEDDYGRGICLDDLNTVNPAACRARYLCSIYLTEKGDKRVTALLEAMKKRAHLDFTTRPKLSDMIDVAIQPLPEFQPFLTLWINAVSQYDEPCYDAWLREAILLRDGVAGLEKLALSEGNKRPRAYVDWIKSLVDNREYKKALQIVNTALERLPQNNPIRAAVADLMIICGQQTKDEETVFSGLWLSFIAKPNLAKLITLYEQCECSQRNNLMQEGAKLIEQHLKKSRHYNYQRKWECDDIEIPSLPNSSLLLHALLFAGDERDAFKLAQKGESLGWSSDDNPQPLFLTYYLIRAIKLPLDKLPTYLGKLWNISLQNSNEYRWGYEEDNADNLSKKLESIYRNIFAKDSLVENNILDWCLSAGESRVSAIVSNQHRGAYDRAALVTGACTETLKFVNSAKVIHFFNGIKSKFPRHTAFQKELKRLVFTDVEPKLKSIEVK